MTKWFPMNLYHLLCVLNLLKLNMILLQMVFLNYISNYVCWTIHIPVSQTESALKWCQISSVSITLCSLQSVPQGAVSARVHTSCLQFLPSCQGFIIFILSFCQNETLILRLICPKFSCLYFTSYAIWPIYVFISLLFLLKFYPSFKSSTVFP